MNSKMTRMETLTDDLKSVYDELRSGKMSNSDAKQLANVAGKMISSAKAQMEYNKMMGKKDKVNYFE